MNTFDLAVIGGGPAGMMAAGRAAENGAKVIIIEKNHNLGTKLLITGKGRCNITNKTLDTKKLVSQYGENGKFLFSCLHIFDVTDTLNFFENFHLKTKTERGNRVFPESDFSRDVLDVLVKYLNKGKVKIKNNSTVKDIIQKNHKIIKIILDNNEEIVADNCLIACGGKSFPGTGSTGDGFSWAKKLGHTVNTPTPALAPVILKEKFIKNLEGLSLKNVKISIYKNNKKQDERFGEALFTDVGMSGPIIIDMSKKINNLLPDHTELRIDFKPALNIKEFDKRLLKDFKSGNNKQFKNILNKLLPQKLIPVIIKLSQINPEKQVNLISKDERKKLLHLIKEFTLKIKKVEGWNKAIITSGGIETKEIDPKTMKSKIINNLFFAGEIIDIDGPTGGYNLQICWSTGYSVGENFNYK